MQPKFTILQGNKGNPSLGDAKSMSEPAPQPATQPPAGFWRKFGSGLLELVAQILYQGPK